MEDLKVVVSCRACLSKDNSEQEFFPLFSTIPNSESTLQISDLFETISGLNVEQNDRLSQTLCNSCVQTMMQFYKFRLMCKTNNRRFRPTKANLEQSQGIEAIAENCLMQDGLRYVDVKRCDGDNFVVQSSQSKDTKGDNRTNLELQNITVKASHNKQGQNLCPICGKLYKKSSHLHTHSNAKPHGCHHCDKSFKSGSDLRVHLRIHTGERRKICNICCKTFVTTSALYKHARMHTGERPFKCTFCQKTFPESCALEKHERVHTGDKPYRCKVCGKGFSQSTSRNRHQNRLHK